jgi:hypothetical protein
VTRPENPLKVGLKFYAKFEILKMENISFLFFSIVNATIR